MNFAAVAKEQNPNFDEEVVSTKRKKLPNGTYSLVRMYKLEVLYKHINILKWWKENEKVFPTIAIMARIYLSRELTSCFEERIFSSAGYIGNKKLRTCTLPAREEKLWLGKVNRDAYQN